MEETLRDLLPVNAGEACCSGKPNDIGKDGDRGCGQEKNPFLPGCRVTEPGKGCAEGKHSGQGTQPGAGVNNF